MKILRDRIRRDGGHYDSFKIEPADLTDKVRRKCRGFAHSGKTVYLPSVIMKDGLLCSNLCRAAGAPLARDRDGINGTGVYFRFVRNKSDSTIDEDIFHASAGVGSTGGVIYFMDLDRGTDREFFTFCEHDTKFAYRNPDTHKLEEVVSEVKKSALNQSEIAFLGGVKLSDISRIYVSKTHLRGIDDKVYQRLYQWLPETIRSDFTEARPDMSHWVSANDLKKLLEKALRVQGFEEAVNEVTDSRGERWYLFKKNYMAPRVMRDSIYANVPNCEIIGPQINVERREHRPSEPLPLLRPVQAAPPQEPLRPDRPLAPAPTEIFDRIREPGILRAMGRRAAGVQHTRHGTQNANGRTWIGGPTAPIVTPDLRDGRTRARNGGARR